MIGARQGSRIGWTWIRWPWAGLPALLLGAALAGPAQAHGDEPGPRLARGALPAPSLAEQRASAQDWVARINGRPVPARVAYALLRVAQREQPSLGLNGLVEHLAADLALGQRALAEVGEADLFPTGRVAYGPAQQREQEMRGTLRLLFGTEYTQDRAAQPQWRPTPDPAPRLKRLWPERAGLQLDDQLSASQQHEAQQLMLQRYAGCGRTLQDLTLAQLWPGLDVQARALLRRGDAEFARQTARARIDDSCFDRWMAQRWSEPELAFLADAVAARQRRWAWMAWLGLGADPHRDASALSAAAARVSDADIERFYARQPQRFERIESLRGWHIQCPDLACADSVGGELRAGRTADELLAHWQARLGPERAGPLLWQRDSAGPMDDWLLSLALAQPLRELSLPVRRPAPETAPAVWELVWVQERGFGRHPVTSETVRYLARQELAREQLQQRWQDELRSAREGLRLEWAPGLSGAAS